MRLQRWSLVYLYTGVCRDTNDLGSTYIEVSIAAQTMWLYKDGTCIVSTPVVTGNVSAGHSTPSGSVWAIDARMRDYTLTGQDYNSEVSFWLPFNGDVGIHDASWRSEFGGLSTRPVDQMVCQYTIQCDEDYL